MTDPDLDRKVAEIVSCEACDRVARYMAADPEMYRGEPRRCSTHAENARLRARLARLVEAARAVAAWENEGPHAKMEAVKRLRAVLAEIEKEKL